MMTNREDGTGKSGGGSNLALTYLWLIKQFRDFTGIWIEDNGLIMEEGIGYLGRIGLESEEVEEMW